MTVPAQENQNQEKQNDKEYNFRLAEAKYKREIEQERSARLEAERKANELLAKRQQVEEEEEEDPEPYVDRKKLNKTLAKFEEKNKHETQTEIQRAVQMALSEERNNNWMRNNPDYESVLQHADKLYEKDPELADTILRMPSGFERQKLVYQTIKGMGLHKPEQPKSSIQDTIDNKRRTPSYQPSSVGSAPYQNTSDFSAQGQKQAYEKMQELKSRLRI